MPPRRRIVAVFVESSHLLGQQCAPTAAARNTADHFHTLGGVAVSTCTEGPREARREAVEVPVMAKVLVPRKQAREGESVSREPGSVRGAQARGVQSSPTQTASSRLPHHPPRHRPRPQLVPTSTPPGPISPRNFARRRLRFLPRPTPSHGPHHSTAATPTTCTIGTTKGIGR